MNCRREGQKRMLFDEMRRSMLANYQIKVVCNGTISWERQKKMKKINEIIRALEVRLTPPHARGRQTRSLPRAFPRQDQPLPRQFQNFPKIKQVEVNMARIGERNALILRLIADIIGHMQGMALGVVEVRGAQQ